MSLGVVFLLNHYGVRVRAYDWFQSYLSNRELYLYVSMVINLILSQTLVEYLRDPFLDPCCFFVFAGKLTCYFIGDYIIRNLLTLNFSLKKLEGYWPIPLTLTESKQYWVGRGRGKIWMDHAGVFVSYPWSLNSLHRSEGTTLLIVAKKL